MLGNTPQAVRRDFFARCSLPSNTRVVHRDGVYFKLAEQEDETDLVHLYLDKLMNAVGRERKMSRVLRPVVELFVPDVGLSGGVVDPSAGRHS